MLISIKPFASTTTAKLQCKWWQIENKCDMDGQYYTLTWIFLWITSWSYGNRGNIIILSWKRRWCVSIVKCVCWRFCNISLKSRVDIMWQIACINISEGNTFAPINAVSWIVSTCQTCSNLYDINNCRGCKIPIHRIMVFVTLSDIKPSYKLQVMIWLIRSLKWMESVLPSDKLIVERQKIMSPTRQM